MFWPAERGTLAVGQMKVALLDRKVNSDFDTYRMTIHKPNSVSVHGITLPCSNIPATYIRILAYT